MLVTRQGITRFWVVAVVAALSSCAPVEEDPSHALSSELGWGGWWSEPELSLISRHRAEGGFDEAAATIPAYAPFFEKLYVTNIAMQRVDIIDVHDLHTPTPDGSIDVTPWGHHANSVAVSWYGLVAVAIEAEDPQAPGTLAFFTPQGAFLTSVTVGALPDMVTFTPNGMYALVANEGEPNGDFTVDPPGSVSIVDLRYGVFGLSQSKVETATFDAFDASPLDPSVRISGPGATVSQDLEPEHIAISTDSQTAWVTLQENNALAIIDVEAAVVVDLVGLGVADHLTPGWGIDPSDRDDAIAIAPWPVQSFRQPDGVATFRRWGQTLLITANEGDARDYDALEEAERVKNLNLDPGAFPDGTSLTADEALGRLECSAVDGDVDQDGDIDVLHAFGSRSFSIWTAEGDLVFDGADAIEQIVAAALPDHFNGNNDDNDSFDARSDSAGPEPEGVVTGVVRGRHYAFVGLERVGGIVVLDVTDPWEPTFHQYLNTRDFSVDAETEAAGDLGPEGLAFVPAWASPSHEALLIVSHEISGTTAIYRFD